MSNQPSWFSEEAGFFGPDYLVEYDEILPHKRTVTEVNFVEKVLKPLPDFKILDVPCGHGRHSIELAKRGYCVTGTELNQFFIAEAQKSAKADGVPIRFCQSDMRELDFCNEFDVALNLFTSIGYFDCDKDDVKFLAGVYNALKPGGQFLLDFVNLSWFTKNFKQKDWRKLSDDSFVLIEREYNIVLGRKIEKRTRIRSGVVKATASISQRIYSTNELVALAKGVGFHLEKSYGDFDGNPLNLASRRTILCFKK